MMERIPLPDLDERLKKRYKAIVHGHMRCADRLVAGVNSALQTAGMAATQAVWRFLNNDRVTLPKLIEPLQEAGRTAVQADAAPVALLIQDWSKIDYSRHKSKTDVTTLTHETDIGYELATALLVSATDGRPLAPMQMHLTTDAGMLSTTPRAKALSHVDQILPTMRQANDWALSKPLVHIIDREADSVGHYRKWNAAGFGFLVRADDRRVRWDSRSRLMSEVAEELLKSGAFKKTREVEYHNQKAIQYVASTEVTLTKAARKRVKGKQKSIPGRPLTLRLVISRVCDAEGEELARWMLLTNVNQAIADASTIALWYYWRWRIESFFKLLKSHGQQIEDWQQTTGLAIAKRLLVASMACVVVWDLQRQTTPEAEQTRNLLVRLSGRQMKYGVSHTAPALLAGLMVLLPMLQLLEEHGNDLGQLKRLVQRALPFTTTG